MVERCQYCGKEFENTKALGSHVRYIHLRPGGYSQHLRGDEEQKRFERLLNSCLSERGLKKPREIGKVEEAIEQIPQGVSDVLDKYREAFSCALTKENLVKEVEKLLEKDKQEKTE